MAKSTFSELFSTLKGYINELSEGERTPAEIGSALNDWARESAESIKLRVAEEVESTVSRMGFIKRDEYEILLARVTELEATLAALGTAKSATKISARKRAVSKLVPKKRAVKSRDKEANK